MTERNQIVSRATHYHFVYFRRAKDFCLARICGGIVAIFILCNLPRLAIGGFEVARLKHLQYSLPRLDVDRMGELNVELRLVANVWFQRESWSLMHLLFHVMVGFGLVYVEICGQLEKSTPPPPKIEEVL